MKKLYILLIVLLAALSMPAAVTVLSSDAYQSQVEFVLGDYTIREQDSFARISVPHMAYPHLPGHQDCPLKSLRSHCLLPATSCGLSLCWKKSKCR